MKKFLSFVLSFLIILNTFGFNLVFIFMLHESRTENFEIIDEHPDSIPEDMMVVFNSGADKIEIVNSREIRYENEMYDVVNKKIVGADSYYFCIKDKEDTELHTVFRTLNDLGEKNNTAPVNLANSILKNLEKNYLPHHDITLAAVYKSNRIPDNNSFNFSLIILEPNFPPPQYKIIS